MEIMEIGRKRKKPIHKVVIYVFISKKAVHFLLLIQTQKIFKNTGKVAGHIKLFF